MIRAIGLDTAGAVALFLKGLCCLKHNYGQLRLKKLFRIEDPTMWPMEIWDGKPRLSVAGVQPKIKPVL